MSGMMTIRPAEEKDCGIILEFIRGLAEYERMSDQVVATEDLLREWIFEKKKAEVLFVCEDGKEVGIALFFHNFSTFLGRAGIYLEDLFVFPEYRGKGYGSQGLDLLLTAAKENGIHILYDDMAIDNPARKLFLQHGFSEEYRTEEIIMLKREL